MNIKEIAARFRDPKKHDHYNTEWELDALELANAYLAEHPADEDEPVTEEWLRAIGFNDDKEFPGYVILLTECGYIECIGFDGGVEWMLFGNELNPGPQTRGQVRLLCRALGIELKEHP